MEKHKPAQLEIESREGGVHHSDSHGTRTCIKRQKIAYGKFFDFWADEYIYKRIPEDENPPIKGF